MSVQEVTDQDFESKVLKADLPTLVDFWAPWCGPCRMAAPVLEGLSGEYDGRVSIVKVDVDKNPTTAGEYGVMSIPTTIMFKEGKEVGRQVGFAGKVKFEEVIKRAI